KRGTRPSAGPPPRERFLQPQAYDVPQLTPRRKEHPMAEQSPEFTQPIPPDNGRTTVREQVRRGLERGAEARRGAQPEELTRPAAPRRTMAQNAVLSMGITNLALGALSFVAPAVTGNCDKVINRSKGKLFGVFAVNPTHALVHAGLGAAGLAAQRSAR